jgi:hypothetical protein
VGEQRYQQVESALRLAVHAAAPPLTFWGCDEIAIDGFHHAVCALSTAVAYELDYAP